MNFLRLNGRLTTLDTGSLEYSLVVVKTLTNYYTTLQQIYNSYTKQSFKIKIG